MAQLVILLTPGMILSEDVFLESGELILGSGTRLTQLHIDKLINYDIQSVKILLDTNEPFEDDLKPFVAKKTEAQNAFEGSVGRFKSVFQSIKFGKNLAVEELENIVTPLVDQVLNNSSIVRQLWQLEVCDAYTFDHSVCVSLTSALLAKWANCDEKTIREIAIAGLMHDIGKVNIPDEILNKPGILTQDEMKIMKTHATLGYVLLMNQKSVSEPILRAVVEHHERYDGSGYPYGLKGDMIQRISRIVAIADVFSAMTTKRVYREASNPFYVAKLMTEESYGYLDPMLTQLFLSRISNYYIGNVVKLSDSRVGVIVMIHKSQPHRPLVQVGTDFVDLIKHFELEIESLIY